MEGNPFTMPFSWRKRGGSYIPGSYGVCALYTCSYSIGMVLYFNPLTAGAVNIRFFTFLLAHYISAFYYVKDKK